MFAAKDIDFCPNPADTEAHYRASAPGAWALPSAAAWLRPWTKVIQHQESGPGGQDGVRRRACGPAARCCGWPRSGKYDGYLLEGMACPGGCVAGAGTVQPPEKSRRMLEQYKARAALDNPMDSEYMEDIELLYEDPENWDRVSAALIGGILDRRSRWKGQKRDTLAGVSLFCCGEAVLLRRFFPCLR